MTASSFIKEALACLLIASVASILSGQAKGPNANANETAQERAARVHSQLWKNTIDTRGTIAERLAKTTGDITIVDEEERGNYGAVPLAPAYPPIRMVGFACQSDAVVVATAESGVSHMTADLSFVYSEWRFSVTSVLQDNPKASILGRNEIQAVKAGGTLNINGRLVVGKESYSPEIRAGDEYLLYLNYIPETGYYKATAGRIFDLSHGSVINAPYMDRDWTTKVPVDELLRDTKAAISAAQTAAYCGKAVQ